MKGTRILEYDPLTQAIPWVYNNDDSTFFFAFFRGTKQRLSNGNTLILDPDNRRMFEVTPNRDLVWEVFCTLSSARHDMRPEVSRSPARGGIARSSYPFSKALRVLGHDLSAVRRLRQG